MLQFSLEAAVTQDIGIMEDAPPEVVDTNAHIQLAEFDTDRADVLDRARRHGVRYIVCPGVDIPTSEATLALAAAVPGIGAAVGVHPLDAQRWDEHTEAAVARLGAEPGVVAIGETGMDLARDRGGREGQVRAFRAQARHARSMGLPLIVHNRDADADILAVLDHEGSTAVVLHCFTGSATFARQAIDRGWYLGFGGVITYKSAGSLVDLLPDLPADRLLIETDAPYLTPPPNRRARNEPSGVLPPLQVLATALGLPFKTAAALTTANALRIFPRLVHTPVDVGR